MVRSGSQGGFQKCAKGFPGCSGGIPPGLLCLSRYKHRDAIRYAMGMPSPLAPKWFQSISHTDCHGTPKLFSGALVKHHVLSRPPVWTPSWQRFLPSPEKTQCIRHFWPSGSGHAASAPADARGLPAPASARLGAFQGKGNSFPWLLLGNILHVCLLWFSGKSPVNC